MRIAARLRNVAWPRRWRTMLLVLLVFAVQALVNVRSDVPISVQGATERIGRGTTLGEVAEPLLAKATRGDLIDVEGRVVVRGVYAGRVLLNGHAAPATTVVRKGDRVRVLDGVDEVEPVVRQRVRLEGSDAANPQFQLSSSTGVAVISKGRFSGKLASISFESAKASKLDTVALTFDDGPDPANTPRVLKILERYNAPATFFVVGEMANAYPDLVRAEVEAGMLVADHTWDHPQRPSFSRLSVARMRSEIADTAKLLSGLKVKTGLFRPPGGSYSDTVVSVAKSLGMRTVLWSVDPKDWRRGSSSARIARAVLAAVRGGGIVLLHDGGGVRDATVGALPAIIEGIRKKGLRLVLLEP